MFNGSLLAIEESIRQVVLRGIRPSLEAVAAPANLASSLKSWIALCWHPEPDERPSFDGK